MAEHTRITTLYPPGTTFPSRPSPSSPISPPIEEIEERPRPTDRFLKEGLLADRGVNFGVAGLMNDMDAFLRHFDETYGLKVAPCCHKIWTNYSLPLQEKRSDNPFDYLFPFFCHLYSHDEWYTVLNREYTHPVAYFLYCLRLNLYIEAQGNHQRPLLYRGIRVKAISGSVVNLFVLTSFTENIEIAKRFAGENGVLLRLSPSVKVDIAPIFQYSKFPNEREWLLSPTYTFQVIEAEEGVFDLEIGSKINPRAEGPPDFDLSTIGITTLFSIS
jgi:hypothetical protein